MSNLAAIISPENDAKVITVVNNIKTIMKIHNPLSTRQIECIKKTINLNTDDANHLIQCIEFNLNSLGRLGIKEDGEINLLTFENHPLATKERLSEIIKQAGKLVTTLERHDAQSDTPLYVSTCDLGLPPYKTEDGGIQYFDTISAKIFLEQLINSTEHTLKLNNCKIKAKCQHVVETIYNGIWSSNLGISTDIRELSHDKTFFMIVLIVTGWDYEQTEKNISNYVKSYVRKL